MSIAWALAGLAEIAPWLVRFTIAGAIVTAVAHVLAFTALRSAAVTRVAAWRTAAVALVLIPGLALVLPGKWRLPGGVAVLGIEEVTRTASPVRSPAVPRAGALGTFAGVGAPAPTGIGARVQSVIPTPDALAPAAIPTVEVASEGQGSRAWRLGERLRRVPPGVLALVWAAVAGWLVLQLIAGVVALHVHARRGVDVTSSVLHLLPLAVLARGNIRVLRGGPFRVPVCWGVFRPTILLPRGSGAWTPERTRLVLLHESAHVERRDGLFLILTRIGCALNWLNPLAWSLMRRLSADAEAACDAAVLRAGVPARHYARVLVDVAAEARRTRRPEFALALALLRTGSLTWRVTRILDPRVLAPARRGATAAAAIVLAVVALAGATVTLEAEPAPTFTGPAARGGDPAPVPAAPVREWRPAEPLARPASPIVAEDASPEGTPPADPEAGPPTVEIPVLSIDPRLIQLIAGEPLEAERGAAAVVNRFDRPVAQREVADLPALIPTPPPLRSRLTGTLLEHGTDRPIAAGQIILVTESGAPIASGYTDPYGRFSIEVPAPGEYLINASALGYHPMTDGMMVREGEDLDFKFRIAAAPLPVEGLLIERDAGLISSGFYQRMNAGFGHFLSPDDIEAVRALQLSDLLRSVARLDVVRDGGTARVRMSNATGFCVPRLYVDEMLVATDAGDVDAVVPLSAIDAMEVYTSATQVPLQWAGAPRSCGAIVIWTKH